MLVSLVSAFNARFRVSRGTSVPEPGRPGNLPAFVDISALRPLRRFLNARHSVFGVALRLPWWPTL